MVRNHTNKDTSQRTRVTFDHFLTLGWCIRFLRQRLTSMKSWSSEEILNVADFNLPLFMNGCRHSTAFLTANCWPFRSSLFKQPDDKFSRRVAAFRHVSKSNRPPAAQKSKKIIPGTTHDINCPHKNHICTLGRLSENKRSFSSRFSHFLLITSFTTSTCLSKRSIISSSSTI